jgi:hypothetical protein
MTSAQPKGRTPTTKVDHSAEFRALAAQQPQQSLIYLFVTAFGFTLAQGFQVVTSIIKNRDVQMAALILDAAVQIRNNVVYVGQGYADVRTKYASLVITGRTDIEDIFNFHALHICGHILCDMGSRNKAAVWFPQALEKAGSCISGKDSDYPDNEAGKINKDIRDGWSKTHLAAYEDRVNTLLTAPQAVDFMDKLDKSIEPIFEAFASTLASAQGSTAPVVTVTPPAKGTPAGTGAPPTLS